jgi:chromosome segregation protein
MRRLEPINPDAPIEYAEAKQRHDFLTEQSADLERAIVDLRQVITELDEVMEREFKRTYNQVARQFRSFFQELFGGGSARMELTDPDDLMTTGIDIVARPPGKRQQGLALLSGGERALTAAALVFAILKTSPTPFCVLDEVDAALDEANVGRFRTVLQSLAQETQFVIITHNRYTIEVADIVYGITMSGDGSSRVISHRLEQEQDESEQPEPAD